MYIQNENQQIVGNLDIPGKWGETYDSSQMWTLVLIVPQIGAFVTYNDKSYVILTTQTYQESLVNPVITTLCSILPITDEGEETGEESITVKSDELTLI